jgi:hypothetical protein
MKDILPDEVISDISKHLIDGCAHGEEGWDSGEDEEDTLTGDLGGHLRKKWRTVSTQTDGRWKWRMTYKKFRSKGKGAEEKPLGADGIFQIEVENVNGVGETKGLLFQSKKTTNKDNQKLLKQLGRMEELVPKGSALIEYGPDQYKGVASPTLIGNQGMNGGNGNNRLGEFLAEKFLLCEVGARGLYYEAPRKTLIIPNFTTGYKRVKAKLKHRLKIEVKQLSSASKN